MEPDARLRIHVQRMIHDEGQPEVAVLAVGTAAGIVVPAVALHQRATGHDAAGVTEIHVELERLGRGLVREPPGSAGEPHSPVAQALARAGRPDRAARHPGTAFRMTVEGGHGQVEKFRLPLVVGVEEGDVLAARHSEAPIPRRARPRVRLGQEPDPPIPAARHDRCAGVGAAVIHHDQLEVGVGLPQDRVDRGADGRRLVVERNDHRYPGHRYLPALRPKRRERPAGDLRPLEGIEAVEHRAADRPPGRAPERGYPESGRHRRSTPSPCRRAPGARPSPRARGPGPAGRTRAPAARWPSW